MANNETLKDLLIGGHVTEGEIRKIAIALWGQSSVASAAFPAPYALLLPKFTDLPGHVQGFIVKGLLDAKVEPLMKVKGETFEERVERAQNSIDVPMEPEEQKDGEGEAPAEPRVMFPTDEDLDRDMPF